jgi:hypothetical protein
MSPVPGVFKIALLYSENHVFKVHWSNDNFNHRIVDLPQFRNILKKLSLHPEAPLPARLTAAGD